MNKHFLSIVIPAHNEAKYLPETLAVLMDSIKKNEVDAQVIVVDDDSTDETGQVARDFGCQVVEVQHRNIGAVRNSGAKVASGDNLIFLDADTLLPAETLKSAIEALNDGCVGGGANVHVDKKQRIAWPKYLMYLSVWVVWQRIGRWAAGCFIFCKRSEFEEIGGFPEDFFAAEEYFISRNLKKRGKFRLLSQPVITSARKLHDYNLLQLMRFLIRPIFSKKGFLRSRDGLELLYEHKR